MRVKKINITEKKYGIDEFTRVKNIEPFKTYRQKAKSVNFSLLFGSSGMAFATSSLIPNWTLQEAKDYVNKHNLIKQYDHLLSMPNDKDFDSDFFWYWTVANDIRKKFFETYKGLKKWIDTVPKDAKKGYVISPFGAIRRLPQLMYSGADLNHSLQKNLQNISLNSPVQNYEAFMMMRLITKLDDYITENNLKTKLIGNVHDSIILYIHKDEQDQIIKKSNEIFNEDLPEHNGIPMLLDMNIADYFGKGELWGVGTEIAA